MNDTKKTVIHLITSLKIGGTEKYLANLIDHQSGSYRIEIAIMKKGGIIENKIREKGYPITHISNPLRLYFFLRNKHPDILHTHLYRANIIGRIVGRIAGIRIIVSAQESIDTWKSRWHWWLESLSSVFAARIIANSQAASRALVRCARIPEKKISIIYKGIDVDAVAIKENRSQIRRSLDIPDDVRMILYIGRLHTEKGTQFIPDIIEHTVAITDKVKFIIIGQGALHEYLTTNIHKRKLSQYVIILEVRLDVMDMLHASDVVFLPSTEESMSNFILEAMLLGKPVVATNVGGNAELISSEREGVLVPSRNPRLMAQKISELCADKNKRDSIGMHARTKARQFNINDSFKALDSVYEHLLHANSKGIQA